jgi:hypothetical protein
MRDVLEVMLTGILDCDVELAVNLPVGIIGHANATGLRNPFQPCGHVHAVTEDVATVDHYVPDIDADAKLDPLLLWHAGVALRHATLDIEGTAHRVHYAAELGQQPISGLLDNPAAVFGNLRVDKRAQMVLELGVRAFLIQASQPAIASHIGRQDGCKPSLYPLGGQGGTP